MLSGSESTLANTQNNVIEGLIDAVSFGNLVICRLHNAPYERETKIRILMCKGERDL